MKKSKVKDLTSIFYNRNSFVIDKKEILKNYSRLIRLFSYYIKEDPIIKKGESFLDAFSNLMSRVDKKGIKYTTDVFDAFLEESIWINNEPYNESLVEFKQRISSFGYVNVEVGEQLLWMQQYDKELYEVMIDFLHLMSEKEVPIWDCIELEFMHQYLTAEKLNKEDVKKIEEYKLDSNSVIDRIRKEIYSRESTLESFEKKLNNINPDYKEKDVLLSILWLSMDMLSSDKKLRDYLISHQFEVAEQIFDGKFMYCFQFSHSDAMSKLIFNIYDSYAQDGFVEEILTASTDYTVENGKVIVTDNSNDLFFRDFGEVMSLLNKILYHFTKWKDKEPLMKNLIPLNQPSLFTKTKKGSITLNHINSLMGKLDQESHLEELQSKN